MNKSRPKCKNCKFYYRFIKLWEFITGFDGECLKHHSRVNDDYLCSKGWEWKNG